jgi:DNA-binding transcriptional LysR family regulator
MKSRYRGGMETRELAYFVAVAEERHFGKAAARLGIAQPPLSRAIKQLERRLGVELFTRTSRGVDRTEAGEVLLDEARKILEAIEAAAERTRRAGQKRPSLVLIHKPGSDGGLLPSILKAYEREADSLPVDVRTCGAGEQAGLLRSGAGDVAIMQGRRQDLTGLEVEQLLEEPQVVILPPGHRLAGRSEVKLAEVAGELARSRATDSTQLLQLIALGRAAAIVPSSVRPQLHRDLVAVPVRDAPKTPVLLAWPKDSGSKAIAAFVRTAVSTVQSSATS